MNGFIQMLKRKELIPLLGFVAFAVAGTTSAALYFLLTKPDVCLVRPYPGRGNWPSASRLVEAICSQLCRLHPAATRFRGTPKTRWALVLTDYVAIREAVLASPRLMAQTEIQLFELNQRTLSQWFTRRQREMGGAVLLQGTGVVPVPAALAREPLPLAKGLSYVQGTVMFLSVTEQEKELDIVNDGPGPEEEVVQPGQPDPEADEEYQSDVSHITLASDQTSTVHPPALEDDTRPVMAARLATPEISGAPTSVPPTLPIMPATTNTTGSPSLWARATQYKRKVKEHPSPVGGKLPRVKNVPVCALLWPTTPGT